MLFNYQQQVTPTQVPCIIQPEQANPTLKPTSIGKGLSLSLNTLCTEMMTTGSPSPYPLSHDQVTPLPFKPSGPTSNHPKIMTTSPSAFTFENPSGFLDESSKYPLYFGEPNRGPIEPREWVAHSHCNHTNCGTGRSQKFFPTGENFEQGINVPLSGTDQRKKKRNRRKKCSGEYCTCGLQKDQAYLVNYLLKKNNIKYMRELQQFPYAIIEKQTHVTKKKAYEFV